MQEITHTLSRIIHELFDVEIHPELSRTEEKFGDYATNVALQIAKQVGKSPRDVAAELAERLKNELAEYVADVTIAGPGFINIHLSDLALVAAATASPSARSQHFAGQTVVIETNNPNPFKDLHIGHASNSIVADTIANLIATGSANLHRVSYHGDVGLHVGKSMYAILRHIQNDPAGLQTIEATERPQFLNRMYAEGSAAYEEDASAKPEIERLAGLSFTLNDPVYKTVYETCKAWSFEYFDTVFTQIGSKPIERRYLERETDAAGRATVESHTDVFTESQGAIIFAAEKYGLHTRVFINSRGATLYEARDLGLMQLKAADFKPDASYIVTANEQKEYFKVVFKAADLTLPELVGQTHNISTGIVKLSTGKMSSRTGKAVNIGWLFEEIEKALIVRGATKESLKTGVVGALRYTMLKNRIGGDTIFDIKEAISLEGNTGPYLQYAHARARSILAKVTAGKTVHITDLQPGERSLARKMSEYPEVIDKSVAELLPHLVCTYLYELAQVFNRFYEHNHVVGDAREETRAQLVNLYADVLKNGLDVLGIPAPDRM